MRAYAMEMVGNLGGVELALDNGPSPSNGLANLDIHEGALEIVGILIGSLEVLGGPSPGRHKNCVSI